jgi:TP901 family phage tail tape measure protein
VAVNFDAVLRLVAKVDGLQEIDKLKGAIGGVEGIAKDARKAFTNVTSSATWQAAAVGAAAIGAGLVSSVQVAMDFEKSMSAVAAKTQAGQADMAKLTELAKDLGRSTQFSAKEVADGMDFLAMAGFKVNDVLTAMPGLLDLAAAGNLDLASAADIVSNILGGMNMEAAETGRVSDVLAKAATSSNVSVGMLGETFKFVAPVAAQAGAGLEDVAAAAGLLGDAGIQGSEAGTGLRSVLLRLAAPPTEAAKALERLGVSTKDASGNMRPFGEILADVDHSMKDLNLGSAEQIEIQNALFGKTAIASGAILQQAAANGELSAKTKELMESQGAAAEMAEIMNDNLAGAFKRLQSAIEGFQIQLVSGTNPALQGFVDFAANAINVLTDMMERFPLITSAVVALAAAFVALVALAPFIAAFISVIGSIKAVLAGIGFASIVAGWQTVAIVAFGAIKTAIAGFLTWVGATFIPALLAFFSGPVGWTVLAIAAVIAMAIAFREPIMNFFNWLGGAIRDGLNALWQWGEPIRQFWVNAWDTVKGVVTDFWSWFTGAINDGIQALWQLGEPIRQFWVNTWDTVKGFAVSFIDWFGDAFQSLVQVMQSIGGKIASAFNSIVIQPIRSAWSGVTSWFGEAANSALSKIRGAWQMIATAFDTAVVTPLRTAWTTVTSWLSETVSGAATAIQKRWQEIASGFMNVVVEPITKAWTTVTKLLQDAMGGITTFFQANVVQPMAEAWNALTQLLPDAMGKAAEFVKSVWIGVVESIKGVVRGMLQFIANAINNVAGMVNRLIAAFNALPGPNIPTVPTFSVPAFAKGGVVNKPTLALIGEGGEKEYIVPQSKVQSFALNHLRSNSLKQSAANLYQAGMSPAAIENLIRQLATNIDLTKHFSVLEERVSHASKKALQTFASQNLRTPPTQKSPGFAQTAPSPLEFKQEASVRIDNGPVSINIRTGPVMQFDGKKYVTFEDMERAMRTTADAVIGRLRTPAARTALGRS